MLAQRLQKPSDWYGVNVQLPVAQSTKVFLLFGLCSWKMPE